MAEAAFIVKIDLPVIDPAELERVATNLFEDINGAGYSVLEVTPWDRPSLTGAALAPDALASGSPFKFVQDQINQNPPSLKPLS
jgi:hypothetical protein